jgi:pimeloyl-ACP methyl ester carboxylesterase
MNFANRVSGRACLLYRLLVGAFASLLIVTTTYAQRPKTAPPAKKGDDEKPAATKKAEAPKRDAAPANPEDRTKPQLIDLQTDDGVMIAATYFPPLRPGKDVPVVMMLHGYGEKQAVFFPTEMQHDLAFALQDKGYAVLTFDFRGHGHSTRRVAAPQAADPKAQAAASKVGFNEFRTPTQLATMLNDIETAKRFLLQKNNAGELNVSKLAVIGCELGASLGLVWSFRDWQFPTQAGFSGKQGQDVQALVLISPQYNFKGIGVNKELVYMQQRVPMHVIVGKKDEKYLADAKKMYQSALRARPSETDSKITELSTKVQAGQLLNPDLELDVDQEIVAFLDATLKKKPVKWEARELADDEKTGS